METPATTSEAISPKVNEYIECMKNMREGIQKEKQKKQARLERERELRHERYYRAAIGILFSASSIYFDYRDCPLSSAFFYASGVGNLCLSSLKNPLKIIETPIRQNFRDQLRKSRAIERRLARKMPSKQEHSAPNKKSAISLINSKQKHYAPVI